MSFCMYEYVYICFPYVDSKAVVNKSYMSYDNIRIFISTLNFQVFYSTFHTFYVERREFVIEFDLWAKIFEFDLV